jgi:isopenicillin N synthase-like dioxygenase
VIDIPEVDVGSFSTGGRAAREAAEALDGACRHNGFFAISGHGVEPALQNRLESLARQFFARPEYEKQEIAMARAGAAWRGWFPVGGELTNGAPDHKEGLYFGADLGPEDPRVKAGTPMHGRNLYPRHPKKLQSVVETYMSRMTTVGQAILSGMAIGLGLDRSWFADNLTADPLTLFRIFRYPAPARTGHRPWGVGEHTDYGLLTILGQDRSGGLQVKTASGWVDVLPRPGQMVCNIGDMLERLTGGRYRSTPHRVEKIGGGDRLSYPFFLDPSWGARVMRLPIVERPDEDDAGRRWDQSGIHGFTGTYGDYITSKVGKVFPDLAAESKEG